MKRRTVLFAALGAAIAGPAALWAHRPAQSGPAQIFTAADIAFGTTIRLQVLHHDAQLAKTALQAAIGAVKQIDALMSLYRADSQISQLNSHRILKQPDLHLLTVLRAAQDLSQKTHGAFDVTVQPFWQAAIENGDMQAARKFVDWRHLSVSADQLALSQAGMAVTLNGIAQGYGVDQALAALQAHGIQDALLDTGEFAAIGKRADGQAWTVGIQDPRKPDTYAQVLTMDGRCMATSGDYSTSFTEDFSRHHIVDPRSGASPTELASVTVLAPSGLLADGLSTACMVLGAQQSLALVAAMDGVDLLCIDKAGRQTRTAGFPAALQAA